MFLSTWQEKHSVTTWYAGIDLAFAIRGYIYILYRNKAKKWLRITDRRQKRGSYVEEIKVVPQDEYFSFIKYNPFQTEGYDKSVKKPKWQECYDYFHIKSES